MKTRLTKFLHFSLLGIISISTGCSQEVMKQEVMNNDTNSQEVLDDDQLLERYLLETKKLREKFAPVFERLKNEPAMFQNLYGSSASPEKWYREYNLPLFEATKSAMKRVVGTDDYLEMWENRIPGRILALILERQDELDTGAENDKTIIVPRCSYLLDDPFLLLTLYTLTIVHDNQEELTPGVFFRINDDEVPSMTVGIGMGGWHFGPTRFPPIAIAMSGTYPLNPSDRRYYGSPTTEWDIMAIYSFKNDRARDILFDFVVTSPSKQVRGTLFVKAYLADCAVYYLPFFPNSGELLPKVKALLQKEIAEEQENNPDRAKRFIDENSQLINPFRQYTGSWQKINDLDSSAWWDIANSTPKLFRLALLVRSLEFNEKIPTEERERFDIFRRELMISLLSQSTMSERSPSSVATLNKGDEHFEIYLVEYGGGQNFRNIQWKSDVDSSPYSLKNPYWQKRKEFYERELANPRPIYTENQMEYIRNSIKELERFP